MFTCHETELLLLPCFRAFKGRMRSPQVSPSSPMPLGCQISDPEAAKEVQLDVKLNIRSSNYKRKGATHLTPVGGPSVLIAWLYTVGLEDKDFLFVWSFKAFSVAWEQTSILERQVCAYSPHSSEDRSNNSIKTALSSTTLHLKQFGWDTC